MSLIKYPLTTDKANRFLEKNQYTFLVDCHLAKPDIKKTLEFLFDVKITKVNTSILSRKRRRVGRYVGLLPLYKKVIITLPKDSQINYYSKKE
uniref:Large ribosomal subunit protein uL23c n=1 Tax=Ishige okamurae TaxID=233772 RepID=A0A8E5XRK4_9PHAE|nr:ribosomal protein L23 [Ishige okamurae]QVJ99702.1 ribosomal protein L23 [Ishige okamurae]